MEQNPNKKFRGLEIAMDNIRMEEQLLPDGFDSSILPYKPLDYYKQYGFKVSSAFPEIYKLYNGIESDKYIPASLYFYYISPYLVNMNLSMAYVDKNMYCCHFPDVAQPITIAHNMSERFYLPKSIGGGEITENELVGILQEKESFIIKPAIESGRGRDVKLIHGRTCTSEAIRKVLGMYQSNYIIQDVVMQHETMGKLNKTSLNTCRLYTYRTVDSGDYVLLGAAVRFGGDGAFRDNACTGGGFCKIHDDGTIDDDVHNYRVFGHSSLKEMKDISQLKVPNYDKVVECCIKMHKTIPYMDLIGWDIAVTPDGNPMLIELNQYPDCEFIQIFNGPMFGQYTDALMERISHHHLDCVNVYKRSFDNGHKQYEYNFEVGKAYSI